MLRAMEQRTAVRRSGSGELLQDEQYELWHGITVLLERDKMRRTEPLWVKQRAAEMKR